MIGGMVPPVAIAIATQCFRSKFTEKDRKSFVSTFVMGLAFITEGAIPFAAEDPMRVIPSCAIGAAVAGALSMYFGCSVPAPLRRNICLWRCPKIPACISYPLL